VRERQPGSPAVYIKMTRRYSPRAVAGAVANAALTAIFDNGLAR
jgi:hypothetical protein